MKCPDCNGTGKMVAPPTWPPRPTEYQYMVECWECNGTGKIYAKKENPKKRAS